MVAIEPVPGAPAAMADGPKGRILVVADYHAGIERSFRSQGIEIDSRAGRRLDRLSALLESVDPRTVLFLGDLGNHIGVPDGRELEELMDLEHHLRGREVLVVPGNHDGRLGDVIDVEIADTSGRRIGELGFVHGHTWPNPAVLDVSVLAVGHEHPCVRLEDEVGGSRIERVWLRGSGEAEPFEAHHDRRMDGPEEIVVFPAFNELVGGTWVNLPDQEFLSPFLPDGAPDAEAYLLDGTRLGRYDTI